MKLIKVKVKVPASGNPLLIGLGNPPQASSMRHPALFERAVASHLTLPLGGEEAHAARFTPLFIFSAVITPSSMCHFSLHILSTKSDLGSIMTIPPRKFVRALAKASTVSTSR